MALLPSAWCRTICPTCAQIRRTINPRWLRAKREQAGVSLRALARAADISSQFLGAVERGEKAVTFRARRAYDRLESIRRKT